MATPVAPNSGGPGHGCPQPGPGPGGSKEQGGTEAYMCRECGYTEFYVREPRAVDATRIKGARILSAGPRTPYR